MNRNPPTELPDQARGPDRRFARKEDKTSATLDRTSLQDDPTDTSPELPGRNYLRNWEQSTSPEKRQWNCENKQLGPLTINADQMSDSDMEQKISDTQQSGQELHIKDTKDKVFYNTFESIESDLELASNLSSSTDIEKEIKNIEATNLRR